MKLMNDDWKYRIKKFQKITFFIFTKIDLTFGLFLPKYMPIPKTKTIKAMKTAVKAMPSRLLSRPPLVRFA